MDVKTDNKAIELIDLADGETFRNRDGRIYIKTDARSDECDPWPFKIGVVNVVNGELIYLEKWHRIVPIKMQCVEI